uniref:Tyrosine-protein kinase n=1 Tax=Panagrolaimus davidi TaxID=227884 RepID=A0A914PB29_9BILA
MDDLRTKFEPINAEIRPAIVKNEESSISLQIKELEKATNNSNPPSATFTTPISRQAEIDQLCVTDSIKDADYYLGLVHRNFDNLLKNDGDFILRKSFNDDKVVVVLDVLHMGRPYNFLVNKDNDGYYFGTHHEDTVKALIEWHMKSKAPVSEESGCKLLTPINRPYDMLQHNSFKFIKKLNGGSFGEICLYEFKDNGGIGTVAVKSYYVKNSIKMHTGFMREVKRMKEFNHKNIVEFYGFAVHKDPLYLVMEFCHHGSLLDYLRKKDGHLPQKTYLRFCIEAAEALNYLHQQNLLHGHICAKHFLVNAELKLCDFNLTDTAENIKIEELFEKGAEKWLPCETIKDKIFTKKSEIWSFGVLLFEIYSDGKEPYPGYSGLQFQTNVLKNNCQQLQMPEKAPIAVKLLAEKCWLETSLERPDISTILKILKDIEIHTPRSDTSIKSKESDEEEDESEESVDSYDEGSTDRQRSGSSFTGGHHHGHASATYCNNIFDNVIKDLYSIIREIPHENASDDHGPIRRPTTSDRDQNGEPKRKEKSPRNSFYFININYKSNNKKISKKRDTISHVR